MRFFGRFTSRRLLRAGALAIWVYWICMCAVHLGPPFAVPLHGFNCIVLYYIILAGFRGD